MTGLDFELEIPGYENIYHITFDPVQMTIDEVRITNDEDFRPAPIFLDGLAIAFKGELRPLNTVLTVLAEKYYLENKAALDMQIDDYWLEHNSNLRSEV